MTEGAGAPPEPVRGLSPGTLVGEYRIVKMMAAGGFGLVYEGVHQEIGARVAIKEFFPQSKAARASDNTVRPFTTTGDKTQSFQAMLERFVDEARALVRLNHPNVVRVISFTRANGTAYMVMDYVEGQTLDRALNLDRPGVIPRTLTPDQLHGLFAQLVDGVAHVHAAEMVHRDIKLSNILIRREDDRPILIDFGSARRQDAQRTQAIISYNFSPPELFSSALPIGPWTDVYSLAATAYACLTGTLPPDSIERRLGDEDLYQPLATTQPGLGPAPMLAAIDAGLRLNAAARPQSVREWFALWTGAAAPPAEVPRAPRSPTVDPARTQVVPPVDPGATRIAPLPPPPQDAADSTADAPAAKRKVPYALVGAAAVAVLGGGAFFLMQPRDVVVTADAERWVDVDLGGVQAGQDFALQGTGAFRIRVEQPDGTALTWLQENEPANLGGQDIETLQVKAVDGSVSVTLVPE